MDFIETEVLAKEIVPVLLGYSPEAVETARRMYRRFGVVSHVFCDTIPLVQRISLSCKFHTVRHRNAGDRLILCALLDFARELGQADVILYLVPCTERDAALLWNHREELEGDYVIADRKELEQVLFGKPIAQQEVPR